MGQEPEPAPEQFLREEAARGEGEVARGAAGGRAAASPRRSSARKARELRALFQLIMPKTCA